MVEKKKNLNVTGLEDKFTLLFYSHEYEILELAGILSGLLVIFITNKFFVTSSIYYILLILGVFVCALGFILEYTIKYTKKKAIESEFGYFLQDLSREYKNTKNIALAINNVSANNTYGSIDTEIKRIAVRISWGDDFNNALVSINKEIKSSVINHTVVLLDAFKTSEIPLNRILLNISKDISIYQEETQRKKYFKNLYSLAIVFFVIFIFVLVYLDLLIGKNFLWYSNTELVTRIFLDNFLLYIALLLSFFTAFTMYAIKGGKNTKLLKYIGLFFIIVVILFQVFIPKPVAEDVLIETINHMDKVNLDISKLDKIIALESISSKYISDNTNGSIVYFINENNRDKAEGVINEYTIIVDDAEFYNFSVERVNNEYLIYYTMVNEAEDHGITGNGPQDADDIK